MPGTQREFFEPRFGCDFKDVRIHTHAEAHDAARSLGAQAFSLGNHIAFGKGAYAPDTPAGRHLIAHELAHAIQQSAAPGPPFPGRANHLRAPGKTVQRRDEEGAAPRTPASRAEAIIAELGPLIMSDQVVLDNLRGPDMEDVLRRIDRASEAGYTYLAWMMKRVDGAEKRTLVTMLLGGVTSADLRGRLIVICVSDLHGTGTEDERLLVTLAERMSNMELYTHVVSRRISVQGIRGTVDDPALRRRIDERIRTYTESVSRGIEQRAVADLSSIAGERAAAEPARAAEIGRRRQTLSGDIEAAMDDLRETYEWRHRNEAPTPERRARLHDEFQREIRRLRRAYRRQFEMSLRYGIDFTTGRSLFYENPPRGIFLYRRVFWSRGELDRVEAVLRLVPTHYLSAIRKIQREQGGVGRAGASWDETDRTLRIYTPAFGLDEERFQVAVLHEIGHSTMPWQTQGTFRFLPDPAWMPLSDWQTSTRATLGPDVGISGTRLQDVLAALDRQTRASAGIHAPVVANGRAIVWDKYEEPRRVVPGQFFHYDMRYDDQFVSRYSRRHPVEDFAESFAHYMRNPDATRRILDRAPAGTMDKWDFLTNRYPDRLNP